MERGFTEAYMRHVAKCKPCQALVWKEAPNEIPYNFHLHERRAYDYVPKKGERRFGPVPF